MKFNITYWNRENNGHVTEHRTTVTADTLLDAKAWADSMIDSARTPRVTEQPGQVSGTEQMGMGI